MRKIALVAGREFVATTSSRAFIIGLLVLPAIIALAAAVGPRLFNSRLQLQGEVAVIDPTGLVASELRTTLDARRIAQNAPELSGSAIRASSTPRHRRT